MSDGLHSFSSGKLNDAFGFATIVACIDSAKTVLEHPIVQMDGFKVMLLAYFFVFRAKMYIDDSGHDFGKRPAWDLWIAVASWIAFIVSGASIATKPDLAIGWFMVGLAISTLWVAASLIGAEKGWYRARLAGFAIFNVAQVMLLWLALALGWVALLIGLLLVPLDVRVQAWIDRRWKEPKPKLKPGRSR